MSSTTKQFFTAVFWSLSACLCEVDEHIFVLHLAVGVPSLTRAVYKVTHLRAWQAIRQKQHITTHTQHKMFWYDGIKKVTQVEGYASRWGATALLYVDRGVVGGGNTVLMKAIQRKTSHTHPGNQLQDVFGSWTEQTCCRKFHVSMTTQTDARAHTHTVGLYIPTLQGLTS